MSPFNPLATILKDEKLEGTYYIDWRCKLKIVFADEKASYVITVPRPEEPGQEQNDWDEANVLARCYILASMNNA